MNVAAPLQLFRQELASTQSTNLLLRLGEIVRFPTAVDVGASRSVVAFEKGLMPLIAYLTSDSGASAASLPLQCRRARRG